MARVFRRTRHGLRARLGAVELRLLRDAVRSLDELLEQGVPRSAPADPTDTLASLVGLAEQAPDSPSDPALARLFPAAYADAEAAAEFRRFTQDELYAGKRARIATVVAGLDAAAARGKGELTLTDEEAQQWLGALNDLRLVLGTRLGIEEDGYRPRGEDEAELALFDLYSWCSLLQESLVEAVAGW